MAKQDEDGYYFIVDRKKDLIIRGGYNVYPREVEEALYEHEAVAEVAVVGIPHDDLGEEVGAAVALKPGKKVERGRAARLRQGAAGRLQVPPPPLDRRRAAQGPDRQDPAPRGQRARRRDRRERDRAAHEADGRMREDDEPTAPTPPPRSTCCSRDAARSPLRRFLPGMSGVRFTAGLARHPGRVAGRDRRPGRPSWPGSAPAAPSSRRTRRTAGSPRRAGRRNPLLRRTLQAYLAVGEAARGLVEDADLGWGDDQRMGFIVDNLVEASAPSNNPLLNPKVLKRDRSTPAAATWSRAAGGCVRDFATPPRVPSMVEPDAFEVGERHRGDARARWCCAPTMFELIQYTAADREGARRPAADRAADDQQVLRHRPRRGAQPGRAPASAAASRSSASPGATPTPGTPTGASTPTARRSSTRWTPRRRSRGSDQVGAARASAPAACSRSMVLGPPRRHRRARPGRGVQPRGDGARPGSRPALPSALLSHKAAAGVDQGVAGEGLPRRPRAGRGVRLAAAQRPDLELLGQQLPAGQRPRRRSTSSTGTPTRCG